MLERSFKIAITAVILCCFPDIGENLWTCEQSEAVLEALNSVLFVKHKFCGNRSDYYNPTNSYIDKVIELFSFLIE